MQHLKFTTFDHDTHQACAGAKCFEDKSEPILASTVPSNDPFRTMVFAAGNGIIIEDHSKAITIRYRKTLPSQQMGVQIGQLLYTAISQGVDPVLLGCEIIDSISIPQPW